ncbi:opsin-5 isoform X1 [Phycodurus eques]|uniref:opsin-5 isoform X1 n=2 Tax=Phycodurus eques TaxID=693459 RepID=UPI002ACE5B7F|nr:opsin-5 isoform X1 [Phycodurus eques]
MQRRVREDSQIRRGVVAASWDYLTFALFFLNQVQVRLSRRALSPNRNTLFFFSTFIVSNSDLTHDLSDDRSSKEIDRLMAVMTNETWPHPSYVPHFLLHGDPFASRLSKEADIVAAFYICIIGIISTTGNGYVLYKTMKRKTKLKPPELMTVNLAIFDFGISVTGKPFFVVSSFSHRWLFGWEGCQFYGWAGFFFGCGSLTTMTMVSLDRYLKICHLSYGTWLKRRHAFLCLTFVWIYAAFWAIMPLMGWGSYAPEPFGTSCTLNWWLAQSSVSGQSFVMSILFFGLVLPTGIIVFSYVMIIFKVKSSAKEISHFDARVNNSQNLEIKLTKVAMLICAGFLIAWIPYAVVSVISAFGEPDSVPIPVSVVPTLLAKSSAMYNPIIYQFVDLKNCSPSCLKALGKHRHFRTSRFYMISGSLKDTRAPKEAHGEM